jgi:hypothetical protein
VVSLGCCLLQEILHGFKLQPSHGTCSSNVLENA